MSRATRSETSKLSRKRRNPLVAHELYILEAVGGKGVANVFFREFDKRQKASAEASSQGTHVEFQFHDVVFFLIRAATEGVVGNLAYDALKRAVTAMRKPKLEAQLPQGNSGRVTLSAVVNRRSYNRERRKEHPGTRGTAISAKIQRELEKQYELFISVKWKHRKTR